MSVSELKARLSACLRAVRTGVTVVVTARGVLVARIDSVDPADDPEAHLSVIVARGLARRPVAPLDPSFGDRPFPVDPDGWR